MDEASTEAAAQKFVVDELRHVAIDGLVRLQADEIGRDLEHVADVEERFVGQFGEALLEDGLSRAHEAIVAVHIARVAGADLLGDELSVVVVIEASAGVVEDAVERVERREFHVVGPLAPGRGEDVVEHERRGDDRGAAVKLEAVLLVDVGPAARLVALLE